MIKERVWNVEDCKRLQAIALDKLGAELTLIEAQLVWTVYSEEMCAGWLYLPNSDNEIAEIMSSYITVRVG